LIDKEHYDNLPSFILRELYQAETDIPSMNREKLGKHKNIIKCSNATAFAYFHCHLCDRIRFLYTNTKKNFDKNYLEYLLEDYLPIYDWTCGKPLFLDNDINCARLPEKE